MNVNIEVKEINFYSRKKEYGFLSNFWRCKQIVGSEVYDTNEHYYQSQKANNLSSKDWIKNSPTPYLAMIIGRGLRPQEMVNDWDNKKVGVMLTGLRAKFTQNKELRQKLLDTGNAILHEDSPTDLFWGKKGKDMLGKLLMKIRDEIRDEIKKGAL